MLAASIAWWLGSFVLLVIWVAIALWPARVAARKGHSFFGYFIFSLIFWPAALIVAYVVQDRTAVVHPAPGGCQAYARPGIRADVRSRGVDTAFGRRKLHIDRHVDRFLVGEIGLSYSMCVGISFSGLTHKSGASGNSVAS